MFPGEQDLSLKESRKFIAYSSAQDIENIDHNEWVGFYVTFVGVLQLFGGGVMY